MEPEVVSSQGITPSPAKKSKLDANLAAPVVCGTCGTSSFTIACPCCVPPTAVGAARPEATSSGDAQPVKDASRKPTTRREGALEWDDYFMAVAFLSAQRSKDPSTQVGACIVNERNRIVGIGCARARARIRSAGSRPGRDNRDVTPPRFLCSYNGFPMGCDDDALPWAREAPSAAASDGSTAAKGAADGWLETKYPYVCHAEMNAILNKNASSVEGCRIYVALFPCNECAKLIIQSGIREVIYMSDKYHAQPAFVASRRLLTLARVTCRRLVPKHQRIVLDMGAYT